MTMGMKAIKNEMMMEIAETMMNFMEGLMIATMKMMTRHTNRMDIIMGVMEMRMI